MAMTQLGLLFIGAMALLATLGLFQSFGDRWTALLVEFSGAMLWGIFGVSALDVVITSHVSPPVSEPIWPLVYVGVGMALVTFLFALYDLFEGVASEASETDVNDIIR